MDGISLTYQCVLALLAVLDSNVGVLQMAAESASNNTYFLGIDMSIEGLRSKEYSYYIFGFLVASLILFSYIIYLYMPKKLSSLKTGEKIMFSALVFGIIIAIIIGYVQLIEGYLL